MYFSPLQTQQKQIHSANMLDLPKKQKGKLKCIASELASMLMLCVFSCQGRLAFQALFSREVLPQSFKPAHNLRNKALLKTADEEEKQKSREKGKVLFRADIGNDNPIFIDEDESVTSDNTKKGPLTNILAGHHGKLKGFRTGFKPYKRCSMEVREGSMVANSSKQSEEKSTKRIRLEGEAST